MGSEWIQRAAKTFQKSWDMGRVAANTATLFTRQPGAPRRIVTADVVGNAAIEVGECLTVQREGDRYLARRGLTVVATLSSLPNDLNAAIEQSAGIACGTVETVLPLSGMVEISLC
jgi:hypothetical protein